MCAVFRAYGIALPRTSRAMSRIGQPVSKGQLRFGDLVFFNTNGRGVSHVGMYIGNGQFVHASTWRRGVLVSSLNERYYRQRFAGARRILR
jgi:cell wall-associated NlpC family hydrolase